MDSLPAEDALTIPDAARKLLQPRRGGVAAAPPKLDSKAGTKVAAQFEAHAGRSERILTDRDSDPEVAGRAREYLEGGEPTPAGAAAAVTLLAEPSGYLYGSLGQLVIDTWVARHGLAFAAAALAEAATVVVQSAGTYRSKDTQRWIRAIGDDDKGRWWWLAQESAGRLRRLLAAADDASYAAVVAELEGHRRTPDQQNLVSYLVPDQPGWMDECIAAVVSGDGPARARGLLWPALGSVEQFTRLYEARPIRGRLVPLKDLATMVEGVGAPVAPLLAERLDTDLSMGGDRRPLLEMLSALPSDEAFALLLERLGQKLVPPALHDAMERFPYRAARLLAPVAAGATKQAAAAADLLAGHLRAHPEVAGTVPGLPASERAVPVAPAEDLPELLVTPPWSREQPKRNTVQGLKPAADQTVVWAEGEREKWTESYWGQAFPDDVDWDVQVEKLRNGQMGVWEKRRLVTHAPDEVLRPLLPKWKFGNLGGHGHWLKRLVARFELDALDVALLHARAQPAVCSDCLLPFQDAAVASAMAGWLDRPKSAQRIASAWFRRHGTAAAPYLVPDAVGKPGAAQRRAEEALRVLAAEHGKDAVVEAARSDDNVAAAVSDLLNADPLDILPARMPAPGGWADPVRLPQVLMRGRERALPDSATGHLTTMLAMSKPGEIYPGVAVTAELCDPESLAAFSWALFQRWHAWGAPSADGWALEQLGWLGDDDTVRRLTPVIRTWPGDGGHKRAITGLDVLAAIGSEVALMHLNGIAQKVKFAGLKAGAREKIEQVAADLGLTAEQLADRLVPDFGLDAAGSMVLDYGPRRFTVGFDEQLKPYVLDEAGKLRKALPKPGAKDDQELAPAAFASFAALKKDVRTVAAGEITRLRRAMLDRRRWTPAEFHDLLAGHPLMVHLVRRLVWLAEDGTTVTAFRVAEDRTLADVHDDPLVLPDGARVGVAHPLDLAGDLAAWSELFADYEILQPFPQLGRPVHTLTEEERGSGRLTRFEGTSVPFGKVLGLEHHGWQRGEPQGGGNQMWMYRTVPSGHYVVVDLDPGFAIGLVDDRAEQVLRVVWLAEEPRGYHATKGTPLRFGDLDPITASEVLAELAEVVS